MQVTLTGSGLISTRYELTDWSQKFGLSRQELKKAAKAGGTMAKDVEEYFKKIN